MWRTFRQRNNKTQHKEFIRAQDFHDFLAKEENDISYVSSLTEELVEVHYKKKDHFEDIYPNLNIFIACFTTCWATLRLYEALELLQQRVLYFDTDSIVFINTPGQPTPQLGPFLGQFKDELSEGDHIVDFSAGGPKHYGYITASGNVTCITKNRINEHPKESGVRRIHISIGEIY